MRYKILLWMLVALIAIGAAEALLTDDLYAYYSFDVDVDDDSSGNERDGTAVNQAKRITTNCALGDGCYYGDGSGDAVDIDVANGAIELRYNATMCLWYNISGSGTVILMGSEDDSNENLGVAWIVVPGSGGYPVEAHVVPNGGSDNKVTSNVTSKGSWTFFCMDWNGTHINTYVNGSRSNSSAFTAQSDDNDGGEKMYIGAGGLGGAPASSVLGSLDEVGIWNRSLSDEEIGYLWNSSSGCNPTTGFCDPAPPNNAPTFDEDLENATVANNTEWTWDVNCSDADSDIIQYHVNSSFVTIDNDTGVMNVTTSEAGNYTNIGVFCNDSTDQVEQVFDFEALPQVFGPYMTVHSPDNLSIENTTLKVNLTYNNYQEYNASSCGLNVNGTERQSLTNIPHGTTFELNFTGITYGNWSFYVECTDNDSIGVNTSSYWYFYDNVLPAILSNLEDNDTVVFNDQLTLQFNYTDENLYKANVTDGIYTWNTTETGGGTYVHNDTFELENHTGGIYEMIAYACDSHTAEEIGYWNNKINGSILSFDNEKYSVYPIDPKNYTGANTIKESDRYTFEFYRKTDAPISQKFYVESKYPITIIKNSNYPGHMVIDKLNRWIDFDDYYGSEVKLIQESPTKVLVEIFSTSKNLYLRSTGDMNCHMESWTYFHARNTTYYNEDVLEGNIEEFKISFDYNSSWIDDLNISFYYNNTFYENTTKVTNDEQYNFTINIDVPLVSNATLNDNMTFNWEYFAYYNNTLYMANLSDTNHTAYRVVLTNCSEPIDLDQTMLFVNFTVYNETSRGLINADFDAGFVVWVNNTNNLTGTEQEVDFDQGSYFQLCAYPNWTQPYINMSLYYQNDSFNARYYYFTAHQITNASENISLYMLDVGQGSSIYVRIMDEDYQPKKGVTVKAQRYFVEENEYLTVESSNTGENGYALLHLIEEDVDYKFIIEEDGSVIKSTTSMRILCLDDPCTLEFQIAGDYENLFNRWDDIDGLEYSWTYNNETGIITFTWNDASGGTQDMRIEGYRHTNTSTTVVCNESASSTSGTLVCDASAYNDGNIVVTATRTASPATIIDTFVMSLSETWKTFSGDVGGPLFGGILIMCLALTGIWSAPVAIVLTIVGTIFVYMLHWVSFGVNVIIGVALIGLIILALIKRRGGAY